MNEWMKSVLVTVKTFSNILKHWYWKLDKFLVKILLFYFFLTQSGLKWIKTLKKKHKFLASCHRNMNFTGDKKLQSTNTSPYLKHCNSCKEAIGKVSRTQSALRGRTMESRHMNTKRTKRGITVEPWILSLHVGINILVKFTSFMRWICEHLQW